MALFGRIRDLCSRRVAGWNLWHRLTAPLVTGTREKAWRQRQPAPGLLRRSGATASMSTAGNCYDNAAKKSFWATLKTECFGDLVPQIKQHATSQALVRVWG